MIQGIVVVTAAARWFARVLTRPATAAATFLKIIRKHDNIISTNDLSIAISYLKFGKDYTRIGTIILIHPSQRYTP